MNEFITIGSTMIRRSNIKQWGVYTKSKEYKVERSWFEKWFIKDGPEYKPVRFLQVRTFQNETFDFDEDCFDIWIAVKDLESPGPLAENKSPVALKTQLDALSPEQLEALKIALEIAKARLPRASNGTVSKV